MENTEITTIAKNISSLKSIFGDIIEENAELLKYMKRKGVIEEINKVHKYAISPHSRGFYTKVNDPRPDDPSHRKTIIEPTEEEIYIRLAEWYGLNDRQKKITVDDIYHKWMIRREEEKVEANTRERNDQHYRRYFKGTAFFKRDIRTISRSEWKTFCLKVISGETVRDEAYQSMAPECKRITHHEWGNVHPILTGIVSVALDEELIAFDPLAGMKFSSALFADKKVPDKKKETYSDEERDAFIRWCFEHFSETKDPAYLYAPLDFYTGGRIGELSALRWEDIISEEGRLFIHVCRMEQKNRITNEIKVVEKVKAHSERLIFLSNEAIRILDMLKSAATSVWIFARNGERINNRALAYINEKYAKEKGILNKSSHKSRKTYGSSMHRAGLTPAQCAAQLGNTPQVFLEHYLFPTEGKEEVFEMLNRIGKCKNEPESRIS